MIPESDEVRKEEERRLVELEKEHVQAQKDDHNKRVADAKAFDWKSWESETGLKRPEIPPEL